MKRSLILVACLSVIAAALAACHRDGGFSAGTEMSADEIRAYREKLLAENLSESTSSEGTPQESEEETDPENGESQTLPEVCYYVESGEVWHASKSCSSLKKSKNIIESDPEGAEAAGKARPCSKCASAWK